MEKVNIAIMENILKKIDRIKITERLDSADRSFILEWLFSHYDEITICREKYKVREMNWMVADMSKIKLDLIKSEKGWQICDIRFNYCGDYDYYSIENLKSNIKYDDIEIGLLINKLIDYSDSSIIVIENKKIINISKIIMKELYNEKNKNRQLIDLLGNQI